MGQGVVWTAEAGHGVPAGFGDDARGPVRLPVQTETRQTSAELQQGGSTARFWSVPGAQQQRQTLVTELLVVALGRHGGRVHQAGI